MAARNEVVERLHDAINMPMRQSKNSANCRDDSDPWNWGEQIVEEDVVLILN